MSDDFLMPDINGPSVDPEVFRVVGHCCSIRLPGMARLDSDGVFFRLTPETRIHLVREGICILPTDDGAVVSVRMRQADDKELEKR